jgi:hypothetical protein
MKTIIAGSREITSYDIVKEAILYSGIIITEVICGDARGVDKLGEQFANEIGIKVVHFVPEWDKYGKSAGMIRNKKMAEYGEALIAVWDGKSKGTKQMIEEARYRELCVYVHFVVPVKKPNKVIVF